MMHTVYGSKASIKSPRTILTKNSYFFTRTKMRQLRGMFGLLNLRIWKHRQVILSLIVVWTLCIYITTSIQTFTRKVSTVRQNLQLETSKVVNVPVSSVTSLTRVIHPTLLYEPIFLMSPFRLCSDKTLKILVYVHSATNNLRKRLALRETWGSRANLKKYNAEIVFVTGTSENSTISDKLNMENETYGDIVLANFHDSYKNLTMKAKSAITWISKYCKHVPYVLKIDDDTFAHLERLHKYIVTLETKLRPVTDLLACNFKNNYLFPFRNKNSKYHVSEKEYPLDKYPPFCQGMAYLMSSDIVHKFNEGVRNPSKNQPFVWLDDVYITGVVFNNLELKHTDFGISFRTNADINLLKTDEFLIFFQTGEMSSLWKNLKAVSPTS